VAPLVEGDERDIETGSEAVFEDFDSEGNLHSCIGLKNFVKAKTGGGRPVYIFDNHNHAFYFWHLERINGLLSEGAILIHIDQHKDIRQPEKFLTTLEGRDPKAVFEYTNTYLNVGNFVPPAQKTGLVKRVVFVNSEDSLKTFDYSLLENHNIILDIDLDFFAPELDYIDKTAKMDLALRCLRHAKLTTISTSPFFIEQKSAASLAAEILIRAKAL
jgi:hypothetical protein